MFQRLTNSWELVKASAHVLKSDKELLVLPALSAIGIVIVTITFAVPSILAGLFDGLFSGGRLAIVGYLVAFLFYLAQYTVIIFANSALVGAAMIRLEGGDPTLADGLRIAARNIRNILAYAAVAATVGLVLRWLSSRGKLGQIVASLMGLAWNLAVFLAVPVLVVEKVGPIEAVKRSARLLKKTWGEQIAGNLGMGLIFGLAFFAVTLLGGLLVFLGITLENTPFIIGAIAVTILAFILLALIQSALTGIYTAAVYRYATTGETGSFFDRALVENAFRPKG